MPEGRNMCRTPEQIIEETIILQEIDDHIEKNNLSPLDKLSLRVMKHIYIKGEQNQDDIQIIAKSSKLCNDNPSLVYYFRHETVRFLLTSMSVFLFFYVIASAIESVVGLESILKAWIP